MKPSRIHPSESTFFFDHADELVDYAASHDKTVHGHVLIWHNGLADWMNEFTGDAADWTTMMTDHITVPVSHPFLMKDEEVIRQTIHFLKHGQFQETADLR